MRSALPRCTIGIAALSVALVLALALAAAVSIPPAALEEQVSAPPTVGEHARLVWVRGVGRECGSTSGSPVESDEAVRDAAYHPRSGRQEISAAG